jgi:hypothetical protein
MATVNDLAILVNSYGVAVRAGVVTPCIEDEVYFRDLFGLPAMSAAIKADWSKTDGIRKPITLAGANGKAAPQTGLDPNEQ